MAKVAMAGFNKTVKKCPSCGTEGPKELVGGPKRTNWIIFSLLLLFTGGIGLIFTSLWRKSNLEAFCPSCNTTFKISSI